MDRDLSEKVKNKGLYHAFQDKMNTNDSYSKLDSRILIRSSNKVTFEKYKINDTYFFTIASLSTEVGNYMGVYYSFMENDFLENTLSSISKKNN